MENKFYIKKLDSYEKASEISKIRMGTEPSYDLDLLPSVQMQKEMRERGTKKGNLFSTENRKHRYCKKRNDCHSKVFKISEGKQ